MIGALMNTDLARAGYIFDSAKYLALATVDNAGLWATTLNYVILKREPLSLLFYSSRGSRHSQAIESRTSVAGSLYVTDAPDRGLDGCQFESDCILIGDNEVSEIHDYYYRTNFPDTSERVAWMIDVSKFRSTGSHAFYRLNITALWLIDDETWEVDKVDRRKPIRLAI
jgi:uncharacterized protein YhbP (UPF0306 family)